MSSVDDLLDRVRHLLLAPPGCGVPAADRLVREALVPGKLLRPSLVVASAHAARWRRLGAAQEERVVSAALAVELLHVATLVHDDIIDGAVLRRGRPSVVAAAGLPTAIVVGDLLLARGAATAACAGPGASAVWARALECMAGGQLREADLVAHPSLQAHAEYASLKTAELFRASAELGALAVDAPPATVRAHGAFAHHVGLAFQHLDDLLDHVGDPAAMGKPTGLDACNGVPTAVTLAGEGAGRTVVSDLVSAELAHACAALRAGGPGAVDLAAWGSGALRLTLEPARAALAADRDLDRALDSALTVLEGWRATLPITPTEAARCQHCPA